MIGELFRKVYGTSVVFAHWLEQRRACYLPEEKLRALADARVRALVACAAETVPYYRRLFREKRIAPRAIGSVEDLAQLPLLDKGTVRRDPDLFVSTSRRARGGVCFLTSGSTGAPMEILHDRDSLLANIAFGERESDVIRRACGQTRRYRELFLGYPGTTMHEVWAFNRRWTFIPVRPERLLLSVHEAVERVVAAINAFRPDVVMSYGSYLETFFRLAAARGIRLHVPRVLVYGADGMSDAGRSFIEQRFGVPVHSIYSAVEAFKIGFTCEQRRGFHLHQDLCHVRILDARGAPAAPGEKGEVVITNLVNRGTVLLNYRLGDMASLASEPCSCGRTLPLLAGLEGRVEDILFLPEGDFVHPRSVWGVFKPRNEVLKYQLIQHEPRRFELRLVTVDRESYARVVEGILADLRGLLGASASIEAEYYPELNPPPRGKFRPVLSLCAPPTA